MPRLPLAGILLLSLAACDSRLAPEADTDPRLLEAHFRYDVTSITGFTSKPAAWSGDTLTLYDYWALTDQPELRGNAEWRSGELALTYEAASPIANDWMPSVETRLRIHVPADRSELQIRFLPMPKARKPSASEDSLGVQDATRDRVLSVRRP